MEFVAIAVGLVISFGLGYWLGHRSAAGIKSDYKDAVDQLNRLKAKIGG